MADWIIDIYDTPAEVETAVEAIANSITVDIYPFKQGAKQKFMVKKSA